MTNQNSMYLKNRTPIYFFREIENRLQNQEKIASVSSHKINNRHACGTHDLITLRVENDEQGRAFIKQLRKDGHVFRARGRNPNRKQFAGQVLASYKGNNPDEIRKSWDYGYSYTPFKYSVDQLRQTIPNKFASYFVLFPK
jgi:hypothetical protein